MNMEEDNKSENLHDYCLKLGLQQRGNNDGTKMAVTSGSVLGEQTAAETGQPIPPSHAKLQETQKNSYGCKNCGKGFANSRQFLKHKCASKSLPLVSISKSTLDPKRKPKKRGRKPKNDSQNARKAKKVVKGSEKNAETTSGAQVDEETGAVIQLTDHTYIREGSSDQIAEENPSETNHIQCEACRLLPPPEPISGNEDIPPRPPCEQCKELAASLSKHMAPKTQSDGEGSSGNNTETGKKRKYTFKTEEQFCPHCNKGFHSEKRMERHVKACGRDLVCKFCNEDFTSAGPHAFSKYQDHYYSHVDEKPYPCNVCSQGFVRKQELDHHRIIHTEEYVPQSCLQCGSIFSSVELLAKHMKKHNKPLWTCPKCEQQFARQVTYDKHVPVCQTQISCEVCGKVFQCLSKNLKTRYQEHMFTHTGEKPYKCQYCEHAFRDRSTRRKHERTHTGEKPYPCTLCQRAFSQLRLLRNHVRTHTGEKPYGCDLCELKFAKQCNLKYHMRVHTKEKPYTCQLCNRSFTQSGTYHKHMRRHESNKTCGNTTVAAPTNQVVTIVQDTNMQGANMPDTNMQDTNMQVTNMHDTNMQDTNMQDTNMQDTNMQDTNIQDTNIQDTNMQDIPGDNPDAATELANSVGTIEEIPLSGDQITIIVSEGNIDGDGVTTSLATIDVDQISSLLASCS